MLKKHAKMDFMDRVRVFPEDLVNAKSSSRRRVKEADEISQDSSDEPK